MPRLRPSWSDSAPVSSFVQTRWRRLPARRPPRQRLWQRSRNVGAGLALAPAAALAVMLVASSSPTRHPGPGAHPAPARMDAPGRPGGLPRAAAAQSPRTRTGVRGGSAAADGEREHGDGVAAGPRPERRGVGRMQRFSPQNAAISAGNGGRIAGRRDLVRSDRAIPCRARRGRGYDPGGPWRREPARAARSPRPLRDGAWSRIRAIGGRVARALREWSKASLPSCVSLANRPKTGS